MNCRQLCCLARAASSPHSFLQLTPALACPPPLAYYLLIHSKQLEGETEVSKLEALQWVHVLLSRDARLLQEQRQLLLLALCDALGAASGGCC